MPKKNRLVLLIPAVLSLLLVLGVTTVFSACPRKADGTWMHCHSCQNAVAVSGGGLLVLFGASSLITNRAARLAVQAVATIGSVVVFFIPGVICPMCMMRTMRCYTVFQPYVRVMSALIAGSGVGVLLGSLGRPRVPARPAQARR